jgi:hypothetical protein
MKLQEILLKAEAGDEGSERVADPGLLAASARLVKRRIGRISEQAGMHGSQIAG